MKKLIFLIIFGSYMTFSMTSCLRNCTCINPDTDKVMDIDIDPAESCSDYSNKDRGICS